ncbi:nose resistant to fluoxetine protein 6-like [Anopheles stephensi]|uniref:Acyltransferase 3 domain-containing protein n=1 Tax=Anopheles stephensi TaxID=30069 RepID=A0A182YLL6_ANOST|nr:nose resistant to fluoxetine protein 6-like [Anopheles stephensi]XP_035894402.1 nose resistant to fluoxetine protein 6-like [Anopheles stephensi]XP_035894403.1 nose resistant to fluoxetine protein 6-like [Anopheles stephensi]XP_035894404.1 nose resistant to fluoxetine protein 6-like [Anopheles stephensi]
MASRVIIFALHGVLLLSSLVAAGNSFADTFQMEEYLKFPPVFVYDDFEDCRRWYQDSYVYCIVKAPLAQDESSDLWRNISYFSSDYHHYDHSVLERGVCVPKCHDAIIQNATESGMDRLSREEMIHRCISAEITPHYNLMVSSELRIQHCYARDTENIPYDWLDVMFLVLAAAIIVLVVASTVYDLHQQAKQKFPEDYFTRSSKQAHQRLLTAFSFPRNIRRLKEPMHTQTRIDLACFEAFRFAQTFRVIFLHVTIAHLKIPQRNPEYLEQLQHGASLQTFIAEFQNYVQTFFTIGGMLMAINFLDHVRKNPTFRLSYFGERLLNRICRLVPTYAFMILLEASVMRHLIDGPFGQQFIGESAENCQQRWWMNLLFVNNYVGWDNPCFIPSWYLATDLQLFVFGLVIMMIFWRWPSTRRYIFGAIFVYSAIVPAVAYLLSNITPVMTVDMKDAEQYIRGQNFQSVLYFPFHQNTGIYFFGMLAGIVYHHYRDQRKELFKVAAFRQLAQFSGLLYVFCMATVSWVVSNLSWLPAICLAAYASAFKLSWGLFNTVLLLALALLHRNNWIKMALSHPIFRVLGKLGYSVYLIHFTVIVQVYGREKAPIFSNEQIVTGYTVEVLFFSYIFGALLCVLVELPTGAALKELIEPRARKASINEVHTASVPIGTQVGSPSPTLASPPDATVMKSSDENR